jgi:hypothetical protein
MARRALKGRKIERRNNRNMACSDTIHLPKHWFIFSSLRRVCSFSKGLITTFLWSNKRWLGPRDLSPLQVESPYLMGPRVETPG